MTCYYPNQAYVSGLRASGTKIISFGLPKQSDQETFKLPCGQCTGCLLDRSQMWAVRCMHEAQMHGEDNCQFITLTYDDEHLPYDGSLTPSHFTNFMKKYRHHVAPQKIKFYHGAEYGDNLGRPHHHACIFGHIFTDLEVHSECEGLYIYKSPTLEKLWGKGFCTTTELTLASAAYVARYCLKKVNASNNSPEKYHAHYQKVCEITGEIRSLQPEYSTMSRGGQNGKGIASDWYDQYHSDIFPHDTCYHKGRTIKTPRYYENLLRSADPLMYDTIKRTRKDRAQLNAADQTPERLRVREKVKIASMANIQRTLHRN